MSESVFVFSEVKKVKLQLRIDQYDQSFLVGGSVRLRDTTSIQITYINNSNSFIL